MYNIKQTEIFSKWLHKLKDIKAKVAILRRIERMRQGNFGDVKAVGDENGFVYIFDTSANAGLMYWSTSKCVDVTTMVRAKLNLK